MRRAAAAACALALAALAGPAGALDLTGTWVGKRTCTAFDGERTRFTVTDDELRITQTGSVVAVDSLDAFSGIAIDDARKPATKGEAKLASCGTDNAPANGGDEIARLKANVNREKGKGKLKGESIYTEVGLVGSCKWSYKLVDPADPGASGCAE